MSRSTLITAAVLAAAIASAWLLIRTGGEAAEPLGQAPTAPAGTVLDGPAELLAFDDSGARDLVHPTETERVAGRQAVSTGRVRLRGRVHGLRPVDAGGLALTVVARATGPAQPAPPTGPAVRVATGPTTPGGDRPRRPGVATLRLAGDEGDGAQPFRISLGEGSAGLLFGSDGDWVRPAGEPPEQEVGRIDGVLADEEGRFEVDLTALFTGDETSLPTHLVLQARHEVYFDEDQRVEVEGEATRARLGAGKDVELASRVELRPACVLRGTLARRSGDRAARVQGLTLASPDGDDSGGGEAPGTLVLNFSISPDDQGGGTLGAVSGLTFFLGSRAEIALFPLVGGAPLPAPTARRSVGLGEEFELKVAEPGPHALCAVEGEHRPATATVELALYTVVELEEPVAWPEGQALSGRVEAHGGACDGGDLRVLLARDPRPGDAPVQLRGKPIVYSDGAFEWSQRAATPSADGGFAFEGLGPALHDVSLQGAAPLRTRDLPEVQDRILSWAPGSDLVLEVAVARLRIEVRIRGGRLDPGPDSGEAPDRAGQVLVRVHDVDGEPPPARDRLGEDLTAVAIVAPEGTVRVVAECAGYGTVDRVVRAGPPGSITPVILQLEPPEE